MRRNLVLVSLAVTSMVALAFLIPFALVVRELALDRALTEAERQASALTPVLAITTDPATVESAMASTRFGADDRLAVRLPNTTVLGNSRVPPDKLDMVMLGGRAMTIDVTGGQAVLQPVALGEQRTAVVEAFVPHGELTRGVSTAWASLSGVAIALVFGSVLVADRLGTRVVRSARALAEGARAIGLGDFNTRVEVTAPAELAEAAGAFNGMAGRVAELLTSEREFVANLSHRLRTPLTALRLDAETLDTGLGAQRIRYAVESLEREIDEIIRSARRGLDDAGHGGCDAALVVRQRLAFWAALAEDQDRPWWLVGADHQALVSLSRSELAAMIDTLVGNVFRHTAEGVRFAVGVQNRAGVVTIVVDDAGSGIPDPEAALSRGVSSAGSTGLGLDIAHRTVQAAGGSLRITRGPMGGARIRLDLPSNDVRQTEPIRRKRG